MTTRLAAAVIKEVSQGQYFHIHAKCYALTRPDRDRHTPQALLHTACHSHPPPSTRIWERPDLSPTVRC